MNEDHLFTGSNSLLRVVPENVALRVTGKTGKKPNEINGVTDVTGRAGGPAWAALLGELSATFTRHLALPEGAADAMALWVLFTHSFEAADVSPRLSFISPMPDCGKSTAMMMLGHLCPNSMMTSNASPAAIYRRLAQNRHTLLLDELDTYLSDNEALRGVLNSGHTRETAYIDRCRSEDFEPQRFSTWAPIALAKIGKLPATVASRSIIIPMKRKRKDEHKDRITVAAKAFFEELATRAAQWGEENIEHLSNPIHENPAMPEGLINRAADNWRPLFRIADLIGGEWPERARAAALVLTGIYEPSRDEALLAAIKEVFQGNTADRLSSEALCKALAQVADDQFRNLDPVSLSRRLKLFGIKPSVIRVPSGTIRGYKITDFEDAFDRYL